jgi:uncharacterized protein with PQ loop repeat
MDFTAHLFSPEPLGSLASLILLSTISRQIWRQAHAPTVEGVSKWLFIGQMSASVLYLVYSILLRTQCSSPATQRYSLPALLGR